MKEGRFGLLNSKETQTGATAAKNPNYILYLPKSSSFRFSSQRFNSSSPIFSCFAGDDLEVLITSSSTKIGESVLKASANASLGRESIEINFPSRSSQMMA